MVEQIFTKIFSSFGLIFINKLCFSCLQYVVLRLDMYVQYVVALLDISFCSIFALIFLFAKIIELFQFSFYLYWNYRALILVV